MTPRLTERHPGISEFVMKQTLDVSAYRFAAADSLDAAFSSPNVLFDVPAGGSYRSPSIVKKGWGRTQYTNRGLTRCFMDFEDFWEAGGTYPHDLDSLYLRVAEKNAANTWRPYGSILVVPPANFFSNTRPALSVVGTAPQAAQLTSKLPPPGALSFVLPRFADFVQVRNDGSNPLYVSFGSGQPEMLIASAATAQFLDAAVSEVFVHATGGTTAFQAYFAVVNAEMA